MRRSQFFWAVDLVYGSAYGRSLLVDLYLPALGACAADALEAGAAPQDVWRYLLAETQRDPALQWVHRMDARQLRGLVGGAPGVGAGAGARRRPGDA